MKKDEFSVGHGAFEVLWDILIDFVRGYRCLKFRVNELDRCTPENAACAYCCVLNHGIQPTLLVTVAQKGRNHILEGVEESCSYSDEGQCAIYLDGTPVSSDQSLSHIQLFAVSWTAACQASLFITNSRSLLKLMSIKSVMPFNHLILCHPLLLLPSIFASIFQ